MMRRLLIVLVLVAIATGCGTRTIIPESRDAALRSLHPFEDRFLYSTKGVNRVELAPLVAAEFVLGASSPIPPAFVSQMRTEQGSNVVVFVHVADGGIPSAPYVEVLITPTSDGGPVGRIEITTGGRTSIAGISVERSLQAGVGQDVLVVDTVGQLSDAGADRYYYLVHVPEEWPLPELHVVRAESDMHGTRYLRYGPSPRHEWVSLGTFRPETSFAPLIDYSNGPYLSQASAGRSAEEWCARIEEGSIATQLSTLYFLCGQHDAQNELDASEVSRASQLLLNRGVLERLRHASHPWVAEYARQLETRAHGLANKTAGHIR